MLAEFKILTLLTMVLTLDILPIYTPFWCYSIESFKGLKDYLN